MNYLDPRKPKLSLERSLSCSPDLSLSPGSSPRSSNTCSPDFSRSPRSSSSYSPGFSPNYSTRPNDAYTSDHRFFNSSFRNVCPPHTTRRDQRNTAHKSDGDSEFAIAADLTLYANPLRCLKKTSKPPVEHATSGKDMVAADLVKYGSPLDQ